MNVFRTFTRAASKNRISSIFSQNEGYFEMRKQIEKERVEIDNENAYKLEKMDENQIEKMKKLVGNEEIIEEYTSLLKAIREKTRLTVNWTTIRDDDMDAVRRVAKRVGVTFDEPKQL